MHLLCSEIIIVFAFSFLYVKKHTILQYCYYSKFKKTYQN